MVVYYQRIDLCEMQNWGVFLLSPSSLSAFTAQTGSRQGTLVMEWQGSTVSCSVSPVLSRSPPSFRTAHKYKHTPAVPLRRDPFHGITRPALVPRQCSRALQTHTTPSHTLTLDPLPLPGSWGGGGGGLSSDSTAQNAEKKAGCARSGQMSNVKTCLSSSGLLSN